MSPEELSQLLKIAEHNFRIGNYEFAENASHQVLKINSNNSKAHELLAYINGQKGNDEISYQHLLKASHQQDCSKEVLYELGSLHLNSGRPEQARACFINSLKVDADFFEALHDLGTTHALLGDLNESLASYAKALSIRNDVPQLFFNFGRLYDELKRPHLALENYSEAIRLEPNFANAWCNKGTTLCDLKKYDEGLACFKKALELDPDINFVLGDIIHVKMKCCEWVELPSFINNIQKKILSRDKVISPFPLLSLIDDPSLQKICAEIYTETKYPFNQILGEIPKRPRQERIRVAYFSADFRNHPVSFLTAELFELHDKGRFEIIAFSYGADDKSAIRKRLKNSFTQFIDVRTLSDKEVAQLSRKLNVDIAIDLGGYTAENRTSIFSFRVAPIQVSYIGYLGTMGSEYIDYLISDRTIIPEDSKDFYSEKIAYLPSFQANDSRKKISKKLFTRSNLGLPDSGFVFACFNNNYKILPDIFQCWMQILKSTPESVLFLYAENESAKNNLLNKAAANGIASERLVFGLRLPPEEYLARYQLCDLFLDTAPYNAGTTCSDALWAGLPVLTLMGKSFASRVAASLLTAIDLPDLITTTLEEYQVLAIELAENPNKLSELKDRLAKNRLTSPLFNTLLFTKSLESVYDEMMGRYWLGLPPDHIQSRLLLV